MNNIRALSARRTAKCAAVVTAFFSVCLVFCALSVRASKSVSFAWNPSPDTDVSGYAIYYGSKSGTYTARVDVGSKTNATLSGFTEGTTNYFVVVAYNSAALESMPSSEVTVLVPGCLKVVAPVTPGDAPTVSFTVVTGHGYEVQATQDFSTWTTVWQIAAAATNSWMSFTDPNAALYSQRYYRLLSH